MSTMADTKTLDEISSRVSSNQDPEKGEIFHPNYEGGYKPVAETRELYKILKESICLSGGFTALLLQVAHPGVGQGVAEHSDFVYRAFNRVENTAIYIYGIIYGSEEEQAAIREWVNRAHAPVQGRGKDTQQNYNAKDPYLQLWVAATIYVAMMGMYEMVYKPLPEDRAERVYQEFSVLATSLQVPPEIWPKDRRAFQEYYSDVVYNQLQVYPQARQVYQNLLHPKGMPLLLRPAVPFAVYLFKSIAIEQLPDHLLEGFGMKQTFMTKTISDLAMATLIATYRFTPKFIRQFPHTYYMWRMRRMLKKRGMVDYSKKH